MKTISSWFGAPVACACAALPNGPALAADPLPAIELRLQCSDQGPAMVAREVAAIGVLHAFAEAHDAQIVWLDAVITADNGAGDCARTRGIESAEGAPPSGRSYIAIEDCASTGASSACEDGAMVRVRASGPPLAVSHGVLLPAESSLAENLPYRMNGYGDWLNYQGPFIVRYHEGTGYAYATFHQPDPALPGVWERARCNAQPRSCED